VTRQEQHDSEAAVTYVRRSLDLYERLGDERAVAEAWNTAAWVFVQRGELKRAAQAIETAQRLAAHAHHESLSALLLATRAELSLAQRHFDEAAAHAEASAAHKHVSAYGRAHALLLRAQALAGQKVALPLLRRAYVDALKAAASQPRAFRAQVHEAFGDAMAGRGEAKESLEQTRMALGLTKPERA
jgi:tetratricopeptide (TPR) repeat protein